MSAFTRTLLLVAKLVGLALVLLVVSGLASRLLPAVEGGTAPPEGSAMAVIVGVLFLQTLVLAYPILRSCWHGWRLAAAIAVVYFGGVTFLNQLESLVYLHGKMPDGMVAGLMAMGLVTAVVFAPIAVLVLGRWRAAEPEEGSPGPFRPPWVRLAVAGLVYLALYYVFGYYVAWQSPAVREFYGGSDPGSFAAQMASVAGGTPWMLPFQYLRGLLWAGLALLVVRSMRGPWWEAGLALSMLFVMPALYLLLPNPMMPQEVRMVHLIETAPYQFLFGWLAAWWLRTRGDRAVASPPRKSATASPTDGREGGRAIAR